MTAPYTEGVRHYVRLFCAVGAACASVPALAASSDEQIWITEVVNVQLPQKWRLQEELTQRFSNNRRGLYEIESNTLVGYNMAKGVTLWAGYTHDPQYAAGDFTIMEQRAREQVTLDNFLRLGSGKLSARFRLEQRWRSGLPGTGWRLRPYLKYSVPVLSKIKLNLSSEPFIDLNTVGFQKKPGLDRVRNLVSLSVPLAKPISLEAGYMNQYSFVRSGRDTSDNIVYCALALGI